MTGRGSRPVGRTAVQGGADGDYATGLHGRAGASQLAATPGAAGAVEYSDFCRSARPECRAYQEKGAAASGVKYRSLAAPDFGSILSL
jgi:hypothetical protein